MEQLDQKYRMLANYMLASTRFIRAFYYFFKNSSKKLIGAELNRFSQWALCGRNRFNRTNQK